MMPIVTRIAVKPTPPWQVFKTVDLKTMKETEIKITSADMILLVHGHCCRAEVAVAMVLG